MFRLRPYQEEARNCVIHALVDHRSTLVEMATGLGKTILFGHIADDWPGRVLVIAHRDELIRQAAEKIHSITGHPVAVEMGRERADDNLFGTKVTVGSVQTLARSNRRERFHPDHFSLIVVDEGHHATSVTYRDVLDYFGSAKRLFVTATPKRADKVKLGDVCESVAYQFGIEKAIDEGWLVPVQQSVVKVEGLDFSKVRTVADDFNASDLEAILTEEKPLHEMVSSAKEIVGERQTLWFCISVAQAKASANVLRRYTEANNVAFLSGETPKDERRYIVERYKKGHIQHLLNCFDDQTEILCESGWVGQSELTETHRIANWDNGKVFFSEPKAIVRRQRAQGERMVVLETPRRSIRVTEGHVLAYRTWPSGKFLTSDARDLVDRSLELPVSGMAEPLPLIPLQPETKGVSAARIRANSYCLRRGGMSSSDAKAEAIRRATERDALRYSNPRDLTDEECEFIGFWLGDGCRGSLSSGGVEYTVAQSPTAPRIVDRIDVLIAAIGVHSIKRLTKHGRRGECWVWSFPRGTGFGSQKRRGLFHLEPYLNKSGTRLFWAFDERQFDALVRGWWMADGNHGDSSTAPRTLDFCGINRDIFDIIQAVACCRGYRVSLHRDKKTAQPHHTPLLRMRMRKEQSHRMTKHRLRFEDGWKDETVWCVTSHTGKVIVRRHGSVTVTGQCSLFLEGFDAPNTSAVVMGRPTKSLGLYMQVLGRGTRPLPNTVDGIAGADERKTAISLSNKPNMLVIDYAGNAGRHKIVQAADVLGGKYSAPERDYAKKTIADEANDLTLEEKARRSVDINNALERAKAELELMDEHDEYRKHIVASRVEYKTHEVSPFVKQYAGKAKKNSKPSSDPCSDKQAGYICYLSSKTGKPWSFRDAKALSPRQASGVIQKLKEQAG